MSGNNLGLWPRALIAEATAGLDMRTAAGCDTARLRLAVALADRVRSATLVSICAVHELDDAGDVFALARRLATACVPPSENGAKSALRSSEVTP
ncbi:hypothetical protein [Paracraurococcus lichenis]|uniref:Uncharacterized protein n=1 Tax=Paracraurococcus lichenis TaxID=3064888 RepID=A0ABT9EBH6_9PROT|nr:hypothetical protein [Paracraurococcus sp. LOR1-02]MDO9713318.1 hypothetical protein [Paracraurococcus sp. LOR1-02]